MKFKKGIRLQNGNGVLNGDPVVYYHSYTFSSLRDDRGTGAMQGARRVIIFCLLMAVLPTILLIIPLYLRQSLFADVTYSVAESDVLEVGDGISTVFCQGHSLRMNSSFNAYQLHGKPEIGTTKKHIRLKKGMSLPDDTLEYWGFFLPKGSLVTLSVCSRFEGSRILVVKGEKNLKTCGLLDHTKTKGPVTNMAKDQGQVRVTFETNAQEILSDTDYDGVQLEEMEGAEAVSRKTRSVDEDNDDSAREVTDSEDTEGMKSFRMLSKIAKQYLSRKRDGNDLQTLEEKITGHKLRHSKRHSVRGVSNEMIEERLETRKRRNTVMRTPHSLDAKVAHGGNWNRTESGETSMSSFESALLNCYDGNVLLAQGFPPSQLCTNTSFLVSGGAKRMTTKHTVVSDGYYYYIFYSDNDHVFNDIYAVFDIFKPTYQYSNVSNRCVNQTACKFHVNFLSDATVVVEVPTRDGIEHEDDDITFLVSTCEPRMTIYIIFPLMVLLLILGCAFL